MDLRSSHHRSCHRIPRRRRRSHSAHNSNIANAYAHPAVRKRGPTSAEIAPRTAPAGTRGGRGNHSRDAFTASKALPPRVVAS
jgi:hypothetical protein